MFHIVIEFIVGAIHYNEVKFGALIGLFLNELFALFMGDTETTAFQSLLDALFDPEKLLAN